MYLKDIVVALGMYAIVAGVYVFLNRRDLARSPDKAARYRALPLRYKLMCWLGVLPLFAGTLASAFISHGWWKAMSGVFFPAALIAFLSVESACVSWYRKQGMF